MEFDIKLTANEYMNWNSVHICPPMQIKSKKNYANKQIQQ